MMNEAKAEGDEVGNEDYWDVLVVGSGNAALCSALSAMETMQAVHQNSGARERNPRVLVLEAAPVTEMGGNSRYTAAAMRFAYRNEDDVLALLEDYSDKEKLGRTVFGSYDEELFLKELTAINEGAGRCDLQQILVERSRETVTWLHGLGVMFEPIYTRQAYEKDGRYYFWGGLVLATPGEGEGLVRTELSLAKASGIVVRYGARVTRLLLSTDTDEGTHERASGKASEKPSPATSHSLPPPRVCGVEVAMVDESGTGLLRTSRIKAGAVILGCGGFEANKTMRRDIMGAEWEHAIVRGTEYNRGDGMTMALAAGAELTGKADGCHATFMDSASPEYGLGVSHIERKNFRKISYPLGIMLNARGKRFVDEGADFRNYTYAKYGRELLNQPGEFAWQLFDDQVAHLLYAEYRSAKTTSVTATTLEALVNQLTDIDKGQALKTILEYNGSIRSDVTFDPSVRDGKGTVGLVPAKTHWALPLTKPPYLAFRVRCGITFTYRGVNVDTRTCVLMKNGESVGGLYACGEMIGGIFTHNYPGGSGLMSGAVFGKIAGTEAASYAGKP